jgi:hypothetical protein
VPHCAIHNIRAPIFSLLLQWVYTARVETSEQLFFSQLAAAAKSLWLPELATECARAAHRATPEVATVALNEVVGRGIGNGVRSAHHAHADSPLLHLREQLGSLMHGATFPGDEVELLATDGALTTSRAVLCSRLEYVQTCLHGSVMEGVRRRQQRRSAGLESSQRVSETIDMRPFGMRLQELRLILRYACTGSVCLAAKGGGDLLPDIHIEPTVALALLPHASALLVDDLKRLCEVALCAVCDEDNAETLRDLAKDCFAERLRATSESVLEAARPRIQ